MARKVKSYSLSDEAIEVIKKYKEEHKNNSMSDALNDLLLECVNNSKDEERIRKIVMDILSKFQLSMTKEESKPIIQEMHDEVEQALIQSMDDIFKQMEVKGD